VLSLACNYTSDTIQDLQELLPQDHTHCTPQTPMELHTRHTSLNSYTTGTDLKVPWDTLTRIRVWQNSQLTQAIVMHDCQTTSIQSLSKLPYEQTTVMYNCNSTSVQSHTQLQYQQLTSHYHNSWCPASIHINFHSTQAIAMYDSHWTSVQSHSKLPYQWTNELQEELTHQLIFNQHSHELSWIATTISPWCEHGINQQICQHHHAIATSL